MDCARIAGAIGALLISPIALLAGLLGLFFHCGDPVACGDLVARRRSRRRP
jgi:hypothetical protein